MIETPDELGMHRLSQFLLKSAEEEENILRLREKRSWMLNTRKVQEERKI